MDTDKKGGAVYTQAGNPNWFITPWNPCSSAFIRGKLLFPGSRIQGLAHSTTKLGGDIRLLQKVVRANLGQAAF